MEERHYRRRGGFVWPLILITLGVMFLLSNLGMLNWNVWDAIWRLWPVLLIAIGLDILFGRRSAIGALISLALVVALIGGAIWFVTAQAPVVAGQALTTDRIVQERADASLSVVQINFGAGQLRLGALKDSANLIEGTIVRGPGETVLRDWTLEGGVARFRLHSQGVPFDPWPWGRRGEGRMWNLSLSPSVPMELNISAGVGQSMIDLAELKLTGLKVSSGIGETTVTLPARGRFSAKVSGGIGQLTVIVPQGMAARIHASAGLGDLNVASSRFVRQGGDYVSANYATAEDRIDLDVSGGIGQVVIR
jgi:LiaI-LiaF-like transmembrane region